VTLLPLLSRLFFVLGGFLLIVFGLIVMDRAWMMLFPAAGAYFMARGACFIGASIGASD
jgi:hypothetical protein